MSLSWAQALSIPTFAAPLPGGPGKSLKRGEGVSTESLHPHSTMRETEARVSDPPTPAPRGVTA